MWLEAEFDLPDRDYEAFEGILLMHGIDSWERLGEFALGQIAENYDYIDEGLLVGQNASIKVVLEDNDEAVRLLARIERMSGIAPRLKKQDETEWQDEWKKFYKPMCIGSRLCICPAWEEYDGKGRIICLVEPGGVFGTGLHQTTDMCLELLDGNIAGGEHVLDLGCGSGILGIAALLLGADSAEGIDIEEAAKDVALKNAELNRVADAFDILIGDVLQKDDLTLPRETYDVIAANIVSDVIIIMAERVRELLATDGKFICSGIIASRCEEVKNALEQAGFRLLEELHRDDWCALMLTHK